MSNSINRRDLIKVAGGVAGAGIIGKLVAQAESVRPVSQAPTGASMQTLPWPYQPLDPDVTAQRAFVGFHKGECMYGTAEAILGQIAERQGAPYTQFPFMMFKYGGGGINGWATVCGAIAGGAAACEMLSSQPGPLIDALFEWYESEALPNFYPKGAKFPEIRSVSGEPLCHTSISKWCAASNKKTYSPERAERCGAIAASVARKAVMLLNDQAAARPILTTLPAATQSCMSCHEKGGMLENSRGKMNCGGCHSLRLGEHPKLS